MFETAVAKAVENTKAQSKGVAENATTTEGNVDFSLKMVDGKNIVWIEKSGLTNKQLNNHRSVEKYIEQHIGDFYKIIESGQKVFIGEDLPGEFAHSENTTGLRDFNKTAARGKNKAIDGFGELIETATNRRWEKTRHTHNKDAKYGMYRYDNSFAFPVRDNKGTISNVRAYDVELLIRNASDGKKYLYDVKIIKENTTAEIGLLERMTRMPDKSQATRDSVSNDNIPQDSKSVKRDFSLKDQDYLKVVENGDADTNSTKNLEIKANQEYNKNINHSLKWHTDLSATQIKQVEKWIRQAGNPEATRITDTANWYKGRIGGRDLFVIYSTEHINNPTILYEVTGRNAVLERNILLNLLEEIENGESVNGKSAYVNWVSGGGWMQKVNNSQNNLGNLGRGQNNQNVGILQGQSQRNGSPAFWSVLENLFNLQERGKNYSLKEKDSDYLKAVENGDMETAQRMVDRQSNDIRYSLKDNLQTRIKYSPTGIKLSQNEYSKFYHSTSTDYYMAYKTHKGLQYQSCVTDNSHILYIYEDGGFGNYKVVAKVDYKYEDVAKAITEVLDSEEHYKITGVVNEILETYAVGQSGYSVYNAYTKKRSGSRGNGIVSKRKQETDAGRTYDSGGRTSKDKRATKGNADTSLSERKDYSLKVEQYTESEYRNFGWARENEILSAGQNEDYRSKFAMAKSGLAKFPKTKNGEIIIPVSDIYDSTFEGINNVLVFAKGTIANPVITSVIEIYEYNETDLADIRRFVYGLERRGIPTQSGPVIQRYDAVDFANGYKRKNVEYSRDNNDNRFGKRDSKETSSVEEETKVNYSLKGTNNTTSDGARKMSVSERLAKYAEDGVIPTEVYEELKEAYGVIPSGESPHRDIQVPRKTERNKKISQTVRTILEAKATPDEAVPTIEKMVFPLFYSYNV